MTFTSVAIAKTKLLFGMHDCTVDSDVGTGDFSLVLGILRMCGHAHVQSHVSPGMECFPVINQGILLATTTIEL